MLIRKMTSRDIASAVEIEKACFSLPWSEKSFEESLTRDDTIFLVCEETVEMQQVVTGYIGMYLSFDEASITNVAVSPNYRKRGCGDQLVKAAQNAAKEANISVIFLEVRVSNEPAIALYRRNGFENLGIRKKFYDHPVEDAYIMSCVIND